MIDFDFDFDDDLRAEFAGPAPHGISYFDIGASKAKQPRHLGDRLALSMKAVPFGLTLSDDQNAAHIVAPLSDRQRLVAHVSRAWWESSRSSAEHRLLAALIGGATRPLDDRRSIRCRRH